MIHIHKTRKIQTPGSVTKRAGQGSDSNKGGSPKRRLKCLDDRPKHIRTSLIFIFCVICY